jgi:integrase
MRIHEEQLLHNSVLESGWGSNPDIPENGELYLDDGFWKLRPSAVADKSDFHEKSPRSIGNTERGPIWVGAATGPKGLTRSEAREMIDEILLSQFRRQTVLQRSRMTVAQFAEHKFIPEFVEAKTFFGRIHYQSMLKYVVNPEEVDRIFQAYCVPRRTRLRPIADWPYLGHFPLREVRPETVQNLTSFVLKQGYSAQTAAHIRNVISTMFTHAAKEMCFGGENPARPVQLPKVNRLQQRIVSRTEMVRVIKRMGYPEREMALIAIVTGMTVAEICGLRWKRVNLSDEETLTSDNEVVSPRTITVREQWVRSQLIDVATKRQSNYTILGPLLPVLRRLIGRGEFTEPDDFVLTSRVGRPINPSSVVARKLKPIGKEMKIPWLSWEHFRRFHRDFRAEFGIGFQDHMAGLVHAVSSCELDNAAEWRGIVETELPY